MKLKVKKDSKIVPVAVIRIVMVDYYLPSLICFNYLFSVIAPIPLIAATAFDAYHQHPHDNYVLHFEFKLLMLPL